MRDAELLDHIAKLPHARANFKQLVRELGAKGADAPAWKRRWPGWWRAAT